MGENYKGLILKNALGKPKFVFFNNLIIPYNVISILSAIIFRLHFWRTILICVKRLNLIKW